MRLLALTGYLAHLAGYVSVAGIIVLFVLSIVRPENGAAYLLLSIGLLIVIVTSFSLAYWAQDHYDEMLAHYHGLLTTLRIILQRILPVLGILALLAHIGAWILTQNSFHGWSALAVIGFLVATLLSNIVLRIKRPLAGVDYL